MFTITADSVKITNDCDTTRLIMENHNQNVPGFLYNKGKGRTEFRSWKKMKRLRFFHAARGAFSEGFAEQLMSYKDKKGNALYKIEVMYFSALRQRDKFSFNIPNVRDVQSSRKKDAVVTGDPWWLPNGGSDYKKMVGIDEIVGWR